MSFDPFCVPASYSNPTGGQRTGLDPRLILEWLQGNRVWN